jgi:hypothetical protein
MDAAKSKFFVRIFSDMDRSPELVKYYRKCVRARLLKTWLQVSTLLISVLGERFHSKNVFLKHLGIFLKYTQ